jgi:type II secretory pathway component PulK
MRRQTGGQTRRGGALIVAVVCIAAAGVILLSIVRLAAARRQAVQVETWRLQARWLSQSALERAEARLAADPRYAGETWSVPAEALGRPDAASVRIAVAPADSRPKARRVRVEADYPDDPVHRVRHSREKVVELK